MEYNLVVFKDTGLHICFVPIFITVGTDDTPLSKHDMSQYGVSIDASYQYDANQQVTDDFAHDFIKASETSEWAQLSQDTPYIRIKPGHVVYSKADDANEYLIWGYHLAFETNTGDNSRGYIIRTRKPTDEELARNAANPTYRPIDSPYLAEEDNCSFAFKVLGSVVIKINVIWREEKHLENQNIDIILDFGNTRTCAILLEEFSDKPAETLRTLCRPLLLDNSIGAFSSLDSAIVPSWFITHQAMFDSLTEDNTFLMLDWRFLDKTTGTFFKKHYSQLVEVLEKHPQMFGRNSLIKIGREAQKLYSLENVRDDMMHGLKIEQSSPKRYYWDTDSDNHSEQVAWSMVDNGIEYSSRKSPCSSLNGELLRFLPVDGSILDFENGQPESLQPPEKPFYPRATTITLFLYDILEKAWSSINSSAFADNDTSKKRRINKLITTFPSGWSKDEIEKYKLRFQEAIDIFHALNCKSNEAKIKLEMPLDEGAASQLPIVFSEIRKCNEDYTSWIEANTRHNRDYVRVMNIDIGGGTTDVAIIEYGQIGKVSGAVAINSKLIFKDGSSVAGDDLLRRVIEKMILPVLAFSSNKPEKISRLFSEPSTEIEKRNRGQHIKLCLIPIAIGILRIATQAKPATSIDPIEDLGITQDVWDKFESYLGIPSGSGRYIPISLTDLDALVSETFSEIFAKCAQSISEHSVDIVILSGKTSELMQIQALAEKTLQEGNEEYPGDQQHDPADPGLFSFINDHKKKVKIIPSGQYETGHWFPFGDTGKIEDAKSVTAVGAALFSAISNGMISGWSIQFNVSESLFSNNEWNVLSEWEKNPKRKGFLGAEESSAEVTLLINSIIARRPSSSSKFEPRYKLVWKNATAERPNLPINVTFERLPGNDKRLEVLLIKKASIRSIDKTVQISSDDLELKDWFSTDSDYCFWQDSGKFIKQEVLDDKIREMLSDGKTQSESSEQDVSPEQKVKTRRRSYQTNISAQPEPQDETKTRGGRAGRIKL